MLKLSISACNVAAKYSTKLRKQSPDPEFARPIHSTEQHDIRLKGYLWLMSKFLEHHLSSNPDRWKDN